jgi:hypothetical protein
VLAIGALAIRSAPTALAEGATVEVRRRAPAAPAPPRRHLPAFTAEAHWTGTIGANGGPLAGPPVGVEPDHRHCRRHGPGAAP